MESSPPGIKKRPRSNCVCIGMIMDSPWGEIVSVSTLTGGGGSGFPISWIFKGMPACTRLSLRRSRIGIFFIIEIGMGFGLHI